MRSCAKNLPEYSFKPGNKKLCFTGIKTGEYSPEGVKRMQILAGSVQISLQKSDKYETRHP